MIGLMNWESVERLIQFIFSTPTIKEFQKGQPLQSVLEIFDAAAIIHHCHVLKDCVSTNKVSSVLIECAENAKLVGANNPPIYNLLRYFFCGKNIWKIIGVEH